MTLVLFEDERVTQLYPIAVGKPAYMISCGSYRLLDLAATLGLPLTARVRPHLRDFDGLPPAGSPAQGAPTVMVNARLAPSIELLEQVRQEVAKRTPGVAYALDVDGREDRRNGAGDVALAILPQGAPALPQDGLSLAEYFGRLGLPPLGVKFPLLEYPHDIVRWHLKALPANLRHRLAGGGYQEVADGVFAASEARLGQYVVTDTSRGPILLDQKATVGPYVYLSGPLYVGPSARVLEHAALKDGVALGHTTKVGGEVEGSVIEPYTNKQHHGFLGHSYLGSWVNLGAGTCNSDLKNTYGQVNMEYCGRKIATGMQFVGCLVGDYAKTAINTGIFTGKTVGTCSMVYGFVTTNVPSFTNYARSFGQVTEASVEVMVATQARMFARRNVEQRPCDVRLLHDMYELTRHERQIAGEPLSL